MKNLLKIIFIFFLFIYLLISFKNMSQIPLHDFDEANRAEAAKNMAEYNFYLAPLTGSPFLRNENLKIPTKNNKALFLYPHLERPPLYFWLMIASTKIFGNSEFAYRLPSFIFGSLTFLTFLFLYLPITAVSLIFSFDLWLSSQSALMDTTLTFFLTIAFLSLIKALKVKKSKYFYLSGIFWGLAILSKGQPAVIFIFPIIYLFLTKKIFLKNIFQIFLPVFLIVFPWIFLIINKFGLNNFLEGFFNFAKNRAIVQDTTQIAPFYWYLRWWFESSRIALVLFSALFIYDLLNKKLTFEKKIVLSYFLPSFLFFSLAKNKVWWYVMPLLPVISLYIYFSVSDFLKRKKEKSFNLVIIVFLSSLPIFYHQRNYVALIVFCFYVFLSYFILNLEIKINKNFSKILTYIFLTLPLIVFLFNFPKVQPTYP